MRDLTESEKRLLLLLKGFEDVYSTGKLTVQMRFQLSSLTYCITHGLKIVKCEYDKNKDTYTVMMTKYEYAKYIEMCCKNVGFKVLIDGSVQTHDNVILLTSGGREA